MNLTRSKSLAIFTLFFLITGDNLNAGPDYGGCIDRGDKKSVCYKFSAKFKPGDSLYAKNITLLNSCEDADRLFRMRHTLDMSLDFKYGKIDPAAQMKFTMRNRANWGSPNIIPTTKTETKVVDSLGLSHQHHVPRHVSWIREVWLEFCINDLADLDFHGKKQKFKLGAFPFKLGRGIALGDAYAVGADYVGFYSDGVVDQYAFGAKLSGEIVKNKLSYDIYGGLLKNNCISTRDTSAKIYAQEYGRLNTPQRGFGSVNIVIAGKLNITAVNNPDQGKLTFEPYALVNTDKEQKIEFRGDAWSKLGTIGLASEYEGNRIAFGFDGAVNMGNQYVKGWDRNIIQMQNTNGCLCFANSHVYVGVQPCSEAAKSVNLNAYKAPQTGFTKETNYTIDGDQVIVTKEVNKVGSTAKSLIFTEERDCRRNGKLIGTVDSFSDTVCMPEPVGNALKDQFYNASNRFRDPYKNKYKGYMIVADGALYFLDKDLSLAVTAGYASGDADPNFDLLDGDYKGFVPLQEVYSGKRVRSAFYMGGTSKLKRPLDTLTTEEKPDRFAASVSGFTDLAFVGTGVKWEPKEWKKRFYINPNILAYWQTWADKKFDALQNKILNEPARRFLGVEFNIFLEKHIIHDLKVFVISSIFIPGAHFDDVKGKPINKEQQSRIDKIDRIGYTGDCIPNLGTDTAFAFNIGFEYKF